MMRRAEKRDLAEVLAIERASFDDPWSGEAFLAFMENPAVRFTVADEGWVRGYVIYSLICGEAEVYNIAVAPSARRRGLGRLLLDEALREAEAAFLDVRAGNFPAAMLYKSRGFKETGIRKRYYDNGEDAIEMEWRK